MYLKLQRCHYSLLFIHCLKLKSSFFHIYQTMKICQNEDWIVFFHKFLFSPKYNWWLTAKLNFLGSSFSSYDLDLVVSFVNFPHLFFVLQKCFIIICQVELRSYWSLPFSKYPTISFTNKMRKMTKNKYMGEKKKLSIMIMHLLDLLWKLWFPLFLKDLNVSPLLVSFWCR